MGLVPEWLGPEEAGPNLTPATYRPDSGGGSRELLPPWSPFQHHPTSPGKSNLVNVKWQESRALAQVPWNKEAGQGSPTTTATLTPESCLLPSCGKSVQGLGSTAGQRSLPFRSL